MGNGRSKVGNGNHTNGKFAEVLEILENDILAARPPRRRCGLTLLISIVAFPVHHRLVYSAPRVHNHSTLSTGYLQRREDSATMQNKVPKYSAFLTPPNYRTSGHH